MSVPQEPMRLPWSLRDPAFLRRKMALARATTDRERHEIMAVPLIADRVFSFEVSCSCGRVEEHEAGFPPSNLNGSPHVSRHCRWCDGSWWERLP